MKYWNKSKELRIRCWTKVILPPEINRRLSTPNYLGWHRRPAFEDLKRTLQHHPSKCRFYMEILKEEVWFEDSQDALEFKLRCGVR